MLRFLRWPLFSACNADNRLLTLVHQFNRTSRLTSSRVDCSQLKMVGNYKPVTHVIFDMDGLLLDTEVIYKKILSEMIESYGKKYTPDVQLKVLGTTEQTTAQIIVNEYNLPVPVIEFIEEFRRKQITQLANSELMEVYTIKKGDEKAVLSTEGAERLVRHLYQKNIPIAVATSSGVDAVKIKTANHKEFFSLFHHIVMGSSDPEVKCGKPAPDIFKICAERFDEKPEFTKCLVFEDAPNGVLGAIEIGMQTVMVPDKSLPKEKTKNATIVLTSLLDFKPEYFGLPTF